MDKATAKKIYQRLAKAYPRARIALRYGAPWELVVATILSAQCTDKKVNEVTEKLFKKYRTIYDYANADESQFAEDIKSTGFYKNKAKSIVSCAKQIIERHNGVVPSSMDELTKLPGIGRKTANVILFNAFGKVEGITVDTHVLRLSQLIGLSEEKTPEKVERDLMGLFEKRCWGRLAYLLIEHGRRVCIARRPKCNDCVINDFCKYFQGMRAKHSSV